MQTCVLGGLGLRAGGLRDFFVAALREASGVLRSRLGSKPSGGGGWGTVGDARC